jgi:hypothetical protein
MSATSNKNRLAWVDRFRTPTASELLAPFNKQVTGMIEHAREGFRAVEGVKEDLSWHGVWNWTFVYRLPGEGEPAWAYLVPDPMKPRIAVPVEDELIPELPLRKMSKFIRDGLTHAPVVDGVRWATWDLHNRTQGDDIVSLAGMKLKLANAQG